MKTNKSNKKRNKQNLKFITVMLAAITIIVWISLLFYKYTTTGVDFNLLLDDVIANILGILPPIIIFNFAYEYFTKDYVAEDMSEQMMETLTGNVSMMDNFKEDVRRSFIKSTISSLVGEDKTQMVYGVINPYIDDSPYNMRDEFQYHIEISHYRDQRMLGCDIFDYRKYYMLTERLSYRKHLANKDDIPKTIRIGLFVETSKTEKELRGKEYLFRENLKIDQSDLQTLVKLSDMEKKNFVINCLKLQLKIDDTVAEISNVSITDIGISVDFTLSKAIKNSTFSIAVGFRIPQEKNHSEFLVSIPEPTYAPNIIFTYQPDTTEVVAYQFLNSDPQLVNNTESIKGQYNIHPKEWIYPVKGVLFVINDKETLVQ